MAKDAEDLAAQAERLRGLRELARVSQVTAANAIGVTPRGYQDWEAGRGGISPENLKKIAAYFGTSPDYIEYGRVRQRRGRTPDPIEPSFEQQVLHRLDAIAEMLRFVVARDATAEAEELRRTEQEQATSQAPRRQRPA